MSDFMQGLDDLAAEMKKTQAEFRRKGEIQIKEALTGFFTAFPQVEKLSFTAFAPYFNDGDACEFSVNEIYLTGRTEPMLEGIGEELEVESWDDNWVGEMPTEINAARYRIYHAFQAMEDVIEAVFGRDIHVIASREGIEVNEYSDHD